MHVYAVELSANRLSEPTLPSTITDETARASSVTRDSNMGRRFLFVFRFPLRSRKQIILDATRVSRPRTLTSEICCGREMNLELNDAEHLAHL